MPLRLASVYHKASKLNGCEGLDAAKSREAKTDVMNRTTASQHKRRGAMVRRWLVGYPQESRFCVVRPSLYKTMIAGREHAML